VILCVKDFRDYSYAEITEIRRDRIYEATIDVKNFFKHTLVLTPAAPINSFSCSLLFDMKLSCKHR